MTRAYLCLLVGLVTAACDLNITSPAAPAAPTAAAPPASITISNTNTNSNDQSDTAPAPTPTTPPPTIPGDTGALPLPAYGEAVTRQVAAANQTLLANSCEATSGPTAWQFLDLVIRTLRIQDQRWGYLCKDANCQVFAADIVAYRATSTDTGIWIVDVIGNHCPGPTDVVEVRWGVLPFETARRWAAMRGQ